MKVNIGNYPSWNRFTNWIGYEPKQKIKVQIERWDTYSMDQTLSHIIHPMLIQLRDTSHGIPWVDQKDVPKTLRWTKAEAVAYEKHGDMDDNFGPRWEWIINEMIWAFGQKITDDDNTFGEGNWDVSWTDTGKGDGTSEMKYGPDHTYKIDKDALTNHHDRMRKGFLFFGKYYEHLWD
jgi:hypothetical protein